MQRLTNREHVNIFATAEEMQNSPETFWDRIVDEGKRAYKVRGGGEDSILVPTDKGTGKYVTRHDFDGANTAIALCYASDVLTNGGGSGKDGVEGAMITAALESGLNVANWNVKCMCLQRSCSSCRGIALHQNKIGGDS